MKLSEISDKIKNKVRKIFKKDDEEVVESKQNHYLSGKEVRKIAKANSSVMHRLEKNKRRKADESEFVSEMKDSGNILEEIGRAHV